MTMAKWSELFGLAIILRDHLKIHRPFVTEMSFRGWSRTVFKPELKGTSETGAFSLLGFSLVYVGYPCY